MTKKAEITPLPWKAQKLEADGLVILKEGWEITTPSYDVCANVMRGAPIRNEADAAYIVRCCNAMPKVIEALPRIRRNDDGTVWMVVGNAAINLTDRGQRLLLRWAEQVDEALALAKGEE